MINTWLFIIPPIAILVLIIVAFYHYHIRSQERDLKKVAVIAHTHTIKMLPEYRRAVRRYRIMLVFAAISFLISIFSFTAVAARPVTSVARSNVSKNRDIILCLDTSGSMSSYQKSLLRLLGLVTDNLHGERVGLTIFDGVPANLIPLSDDYGAVIEMVEELSHNFSSYGMSVMGDTVSAIGDGVMGCINSFDKLESSRSKSIIIATDNMAGEGETVDINQAARYAKRYGVTFYGISVNSGETTNELLFQNAVSLTGGSFYNIYSKSPDTTIPENLVQKVLMQEAAKIEGAPELIYKDDPALLLFVSGISFIIFIAIIWRLRL